MSKIKKTEKETEKEKDVFISYAEEDENIASLINNLLEKAGLSTWFYKRSSKIGTSNISSVDEGIADSKNGIILLSKNYIKKVSSQNCALKTEFPALMSEYQYENFKIIPIWFNISLSEVRSFSRQLSSIKGIPLKDEKNMDRVTQKVLKDIDPKKYDEFVIAKKEETMPRPKRGISKGVEKLKGSKAKCGVFQELYYLVFIYLLKSISFDKKGEKKRKKVRQILSITAQQEDLFLKTLGRLDLIERTYSLVTPKNKKLAQYLLNELIRHGEIDLDNIAEQFLK